ncbi:unnamed protein product [Paramecium primaurelia]|uniref:Transmembrane protein n=1 Tax=Paramecium primaurelia TaxID=5886 RepID=A0A8S1MWY2_PARPR|nr:unnamed protein product [Paramecium primaurelia]CAD8082531.1 unnamed protein product [Paramecium primaurelia]
MNIIKNIQKFIRLHKELILIYYYLLKRSKLMPYFLGILSLFVIVKLLLITNPRVKRNITVTGGSDSKQGFNILRVTKKNELYKLLKHFQVETIIIIADFTQNPSIEFMKDLTLNQDIQILQLWQMMPNINKIQNLDGINMLLTQLSYSFSKVYSCIACAFINLLWYNDNQSSSEYNCICEFSIQAKRNKPGE